MFEEPIAIIVLISAAILAAAAVSSRFSFGAGREGITQRADLSKPHATPSISEFALHETSQSSESSVQVNQGTSISAVQEAPPPFEESSPKAQTAISADVMALRGTTGNSELAIGSTIVIPIPRKRVRSRSAGLPPSGRPVTPKRRSRKMVVSSPALHETTSSTELPTQ